MYHHYFCFIGEFSTIVTNLRMFLFSLVALVRCDLQFERVLVNLFCIQFISWSFSMKIQY